MTIHTSIQFRPLVATRKLIQMYVLQAQSAPPHPPGRRFSSRASHCYSLPVNRSCTQVVTFLYGRRSLCSGTTPEGKPEVDYQSGEGVRNLQNKLGSEPCACSLWEWFSWFLLCLSEGLFVLFDSGLDSFGGGRWFIQLWMLAWAACVVVWACLTTSLWVLVTRRIDAHRVMESGSCQLCTELGWTLWY